MEVGFFAELQIFEFPSLIDQMCVSSLVLRQSANINFPAERNIDLFHGSAFYHSRKCVRVC